MLTDERSRGSAPAPKLTVVSQLNGCEAEHAFRYIQNENAIEVVEPREIRHCRGVHHDAVPVKSTLSRLSRDGIDWLVMNLGKVPGSPCRTFDVGYFLVSF